MGPIRRVGAPHVALNGPQRPPAPGGQGGLGSFGPGAPPAVMPMSIAAPHPTRLSAEDLTKERDILQEQGFIPVKGLDSYFTRLPPITIEQIFRTYYSPTPTTAGATAVVRLGGFQVPPNAIAVIFSMDFVATVLAGDVETAVPPGAFGRNLSFAAYDNANQLGAFAGANQAPAGSFVYGEVAPEQQLPQVPAGAIQRVGTGPGMLPAPQQAYYIRGGHQLFFTMTVLAALDVAIQTGMVTVSGIMGPERDILERIGTGLV